jgi:hypothetical protein
VFSGKLSPVTTHSEEAERVGAELEQKAAVVPEPVPGAGEAGPREAGPREVGGREGPEPTRFGDWELRGRCIDF